MATPLNGNYKSSVWYYTCLLINVFIYLLWWGCICTRIHVETESHFSDLFFETQSLTEPGACHSG